MSLNVQEFWRKYYQHLTSYISWWAMSEEEEGVDEYSEVDESDTGEDADPEDVVELELVDKYD